MIGAFSCSGYEYVLEVSLSCFITTNVIYKMYF